MSMKDFDYENDVTSPFPRDEEDTDAADETWYRAIVAELQEPGTVAYTSEAASDAVDEAGLKEAAISEAAMRVSLHKRGSRIDEETAAIMVMPDYTAVCFIRNGKRFTLRMSVGDLFVITPDTLFTQGPN